MFAHAKHQRSCVELRCERPPPHCVWQAFARQKGSVANAVIVIRARCCLAHGTAPSGTFFLALEPMVEAVEAASPDGGRGADGGGGAGAVELPLLRVRGRRGREDGEECGKNVDTDDE